MKREDFLCLNELRPLLQSLEESYPDEEVKTMAADIMVAIATQCLIMTDNIDTNPKELMQKTIKKTKMKEKLLIEEIKEKRESRFDNTTLSAELESLSKGQSSTNVLNETDISPEMKKGLEELCDPNVAVRGHGLIRLSRILENSQGSPLPDHHLNLLGRTFIENLRHSDSYVYLSAIRGLSALATKNPKQYLTILCELYRLEKSTTVKLNLGEVLVKVSRTLGELIQ